jgi:epoxyqueuosine reductase
MRVELDDKLRAAVDQWCADFWGVADLEPAQEFIVDQGGDMVAGYPRAVSVGIALPGQIVDQLPRSSERSVAVSYRHQYRTVNQRLDLVASHITSVLQQQGFRAFPVPASERIDDERICAVFSHKLAAHLAGLGWIGKNCMLITPQVGPRARWVTVLTDAPLTVSGLAIPEDCGACRDCVDMCPVGAFTGERFREEDAREVRYDAGKCERYFHEIEKVRPGPPVCGLCVYVCPHGRETA